jgi:hypothetical protein
MHGMAPNSTMAALRRWRHHYIIAYIVELDGHAMFNSTDLTACVHTHQAHLTTPHPTLYLTLALECKEALHNTGVSPRMHLDQLHQVIHILSKIGEDTVLLDEDLPDNDGLVSVTHSVATYTLPSPPYMLPDLQDVDPNYEMGTQPRSK